MGETPTGEALGLIQPQAGQGAKRGVRAQRDQGGAGKEHPNRKGWISSKQRVPWDVGNCHREP